MMPKNEFVELFGHRFADTVEAQLHDANVVLHPLVDDSAGNFDGLR